MTAETQTTAAETSAAQPAPETVTSASAWRAAAQEGELYRLPGSGHIARLRRVSFYALALAGAKVNPLAESILKRMRGKAENEKDSPSRRAAALAESAEAMHAAAALVFVEPRVVIDRAPDYDAGEIAASDLHDTDLSWIYFDFCQGGADAVKPFRVSASARTA